MKPSRYIVADKYQRSSQYQVEDYGQREGIELTAVKRWRRPVRGYKPAVGAGR